jgi:hypothetical protein
LKINIDLTAKANSLIWLHRFLIEDLDSVVDLRRSVVAQHDVGEASPENMALK